MRPARTLLIDNYDSFTHNLYQLIIHVNGIPPVVIQNDEKDWKREYLSYFDNIVISPGPGHPERKSDFGLCSDIISISSIPILGVCLGHQGICAIHGAKIDLAPEPRHGRISLITHDQAGLFENIPSPFHAVRYHSLAAYDLPEEIEATAWSEEGLIMAIRHREKPFFGVQFHPESICTEYGETLFHNFSRITRQWHAQSTRTIPVPIPKEWFQPRKTPHIESSAKKESPKAEYDILYQKTSSAIPPEMLFDHIFRQSSHAIWLDSSRHAYGSGRFSIMCDAGGPLGRVAIADVSTNKIDLISAEKTETIQGDFFNWLEKDLQCYDIIPPETPFEFTLGWVGYIGYEIKSLCEGGNEHASSCPDAYMVFCDRALVIDHETNEIWLLALATPSCQEQAKKWLSKTAGKLAKKTIQWPEAAPLPEKLSLQSPLVLRHSKTDYVALINRCQEALTQGESYEICLTNMASASCDADPWLVWRMLRRTNPAPYGAYMQLDSLSILSCSPECFLHISRDKTIESKPIKGTRPRSENPLEDRELKEALLNSEKERAENLMIVDLLRNDLGRIAEAGTVNVPRLFDIESYQTVHQMVSTVSAKIRHNISSSECVRAAFPGGSMTGAPKRRTLDIIDQLEGGARGIYSGVLGYFSLCGSADLSIIIRTLVIKNGELSFGVGGAITVLSDPEEEFEEIRVKARAFLALFDTDFSDADNLSEKRKSDE